MNINKNRKKVHDSHFMYKYLPGQILFWLGFLFAHRSSMYGELHGEVSALPLLLIVPGIVLLVAYRLRGKV